MAYSLLSDFDGTRYDWLIRVRVCRQWKFINYKCSPDMISLDMIPIDEKETLMHTIIWKNQVNKFHDKLSEGFAVIIRNIKVSALTGDYRPVQSNFKITFLRKTAIQKLQVDIFYIPQNCFKFIQPEIIHSSINKHILLSDVVGCLCGIGDVESVGSKLQKRDIHILIDPEDLNIKARITLWVDHGESFYPYVYPNDFGPYIVIITSTTVKKFRGELTFAITAASKIYVNLKMDNITALLHKFSKKSIDVVTIASRNSGNVPDAQAMLEKRMTVAELLDSEWCPDIEEWVVAIRAQITAIENFFDWVKRNSKIQLNKETSMRKDQTQTTVKNFLMRDTFISKQRVYSRKFKKRRNLFIADSEKSDGDTIKVQSRVILMLGP
uniref:Replication protein A 70 kDa DNA-binding subunit B/D first OB fold domain-containing protein n=1 Tax=Solanum lycopersicum TaxID=4081 RepID=K4D0J6_SOLLC